MGNIERYSVKVCDLCGTQAADIGYACNHAQGGSARFERIEVVPLSHLEGAVKAGDDIAHMLARAPGIDPMRAVLLERWREAAHPTTSRGQ